MSTFRRNILSPSCNLLKFTKIGKSYSFKTLYYLFLTSLFTHCFKCSISLLKTCIAALLCHITACYTTSLLCCTTSLLVIPHHCLLYHITACYTKSLLCCTTSLLVIPRHCLLYHITACYTTSLLVIPRHCLLYHVTACYTTSLLVIPRHFLFLCRFFFKMLHFVFEKLCQSFLEAETGLCVLYDNQCG
jgi:hypothetical protein